MESSILSEVHNTSILRKGLPADYTVISTSLAYQIVSPAPPLAPPRSGLERSDFVPWSILPLVAGLFVVVEALDKSGLIRQLANILQQAADRSTILTAWASGLVLGVVTNLVNNLPAGLVGGSAVRLAGSHDPLKRAILIGVDLGPNLSVTGSLATILRLNALRREGRSVTALWFLKIGLLVMPPALLLTIGTALFFN